MMKHFAMAAALFALAAQTPTPAPIRHLEYRVSVHITSPSQSASYDGTSTSLTSSGGNEVTDVDVLAAANDGGLVVRAQSLREHQIRPEPAVTCAIYGDGRVICPPHSQVSEATNLLLGLLGRGFYDPTQVAADETWTKTYQDSNVSITSKFKRTSASAVNPVVMDEHTDVLPKRTMNDAWSSDTHIVYDAAMSVPVTVHDTAFAKDFAANGGMTIIDVQLTQDSFAKHP